MGVDFLKNKNDSMSLIMFSTTCFEKRGGLAAPSYPMHFHESENGSGKDGYVIYC